MAVWAIAVPGLGVQVLTRFGSAAPQEVRVVFVLAGAAAASLLGWGLLAVLERHTPRAHAIWGGAAILVLLASLSLPLAAATTTSGTLALVMMHLAVAAVLIPSLLRSAATTRPRS